MSTPWIRKRLDQDLAAGGQLCALIHLLLSRMLIVIPRRLRDCAPDYTGAPSGCGGCI